MARASRRPFPPSECLMMQSSVSFLGFNVVGFFSGLGLMSPSRSQEFKSQTRT